MDAVQVPNQTTSTGPLLKLTLYVAAVLLGAALLTPWLAQLGHWFLIQAGDDPQGLTGWLAAEVRKADLARYFSRCSQLFAVLLLWPLVRWTGMDRSLFPPFRPAAKGLWSYARGFLLAGGLLLLLGWALKFAGAYRLRPDAPWSGVLTPLSAALGAGILEELFFRGALLGLLLRYLPTTRAVLGCSFLFAFVHFLRPPGDWEPPQADLPWTTGFEVLGAILGGFADTDFLLAEFATLFGVGWVLAWARLRTGQLWLAMGLHGGWIFGLKYFSAVTHGSKALKAGEHLPWIGDNLKIGLLPLAIIALTGWVAVGLSARGETTVKKQ